MLFTKYGCLTRAYTYRLQSALNFLPIWHFGILTFSSFPRYHIGHYLPILIEWGSGPLWKPNTGEFFRQNPPPQKKNQQGNKLVLQEKGPSSRLVVASGAHKYSFSLPTLGFFVQTTNQKKIYPSSCVNALTNSNSEGHDNQLLYMHFI